MTDYVIVTGGTRGIGLAIAKKLSTSTSHVIVVARTAKSHDNSLETQSSETGGKLTFVTMDLSDVATVSAKFNDSVLSLIEQKNANSVTVVLNAGLAFIDRCGEQKSESIISLMNVNSITPLLMVEQVIAKMQNWGTVRVLCIGSGAGSTAYHGWTSYGASKAALAHMCRIVQLEQKDQDKPVRICCYGPGVVETDMQKAIRSSPSLLPTVKILTDMKTQDKVFTPEFAADLAIGFLQSEDYGLTQPTEDAYILLAAKEEKK